MDPKPDAFMSYTRFDDQHNSGYLTTFRDRLSGEVRAQTGKAFHIFQDIVDIGLGQQFAPEIEAALQASTFFIPIITPSFFESEYCRAEVERFLVRETELGRNDLILPIYYIKSDRWEDPDQRAADPIAQQLKLHQYVDWRALRFEELDRPKVRQELAKMAEQIKAALKRVNLPPRSQVGSEVLTDISKPAPQPRPQVGSQVLPLDQACQKLNEAHDKAKNIFDRFSNASDIWPDQCDRAVQSIQEIDGLIQDISALLEQKQHIPPSIANKHYRISTEIHHIIEQTGQLRPLISQFRHVCRKVTAIHQRREITSRLSTLVESIEYLATLLLPTSAPLSAKERQHLQKLLTTKKKRCDVLEMQQATMGIHTPPHITIELDDLKSEIADLEAKLQNSAR